MFARQRTVVTGVQPAPRPYPFQHGDQGSYRPVIQSGTFRGHWCFYACKNPDLHPPFLYSSSLETAQEPVSSSLVPRSQTHGMRMDSAYNPIALPDIPFMRPSSTSTFEDVEATQQFDGSDPNYIAVRCPWDHCGEMIPGTRRHWNHHLRQHEHGSINSHPMVCQFDSCYQMINGNNIARHILTSHAKKERFLCSGCGTEISRDDAFSRHSRNRPMCRGSSLVSASVYLAAFEAEAEAKAKVVERREIQRRVKAPPKMRPPKKGADLSGKSSRKASKRRPLMYVFIYLQDLVWPANLFRFPS
jgi:hypothetical protein